MAKAPQAGRAKTRLVPPLTHEEAAAMSAAFLRDVTDNIALAARDAPIDGWIAYAPAGTEALFDGHLAPGTQIVLADGSRPMPTGVQGFGRSLLHAVQALLEAGYGSACVLNSDSPTLPTRTLSEAADLLAPPGDRAVLGAAEDGGYYVLGVKAAHARLFEDIAWSTDRVADETRERARSIGLELAELEPWYDVDDHQALRRLNDELDGRNGAKGYAAPCTAACMDRLGLPGLLRVAG